MRPSLASAAALLTGALVGLVGCRAVGGDGDGRGDDAPRGDGDRPGDARARPDGGGAAAGPDAREDPPGAAAARRACRRLANLGDDLAVRALAGVAPDGRLVLLASGGPAGGVAPYVLEPAASAPAPLLDPRVAGRCRAASLAPGDPLVAAVCTHDPGGANPDGSDELFLLGRGGAFAAQLTASANPWSAIVTVAADGAGRRVAFLAGGELHLADLVAGTLESLGSISSYRAGEVLRFDASGRYLLAGDAPAQTLVRIDTLTGAWQEFPAGGSGVFAPDGTLAATGDRVAYLSSRDVVGDNPQGGVQVFVWDAATGTTVQLTRLAAGAQRVRSVRLDGAGGRVAFLAFAPPDGATPTAPLWATPHVAFADLAPAGAAPTPLGALDVHPLGRPAAELALAPAGDVAFVRVLESGKNGAGLVSVRLADGALTELHRPKVTAEIVALSGDGRRAIVRQPAGADVPLGLVATDGTRAPIAVPWPGALDPEGRRVVGLVPLDGQPELLELTIHDVATGKSWPAPGLRARAGDGPLGPGGVVLAADGRRALFLSSLALGTLVADAPDGQRLFWVDLEGGEHRMLVAGIDDDGIAAALDADGARVLHWMPPSADGAAELVLRDVPRGTLRVLHRAAGAPANQPVALSARGAIAAFCLPMGWDAACRLVTLPLDEDGSPAGPPRSFPGLDVTSSLSIGPDERTITFVGSSPAGGGLLRFDTTAGVLTRLQPRVMSEAFVAGDTCAWSGIDGGAIVALPDP